MTVRSEEVAVRPAAAGKPGFRRVLLKLSGEALMGDRDYGIDPGVVEGISTEIVALRDSGVGIAIVVGGGNFYRGMAAAAEGMERATADYAGMLATLLNALALQDALEQQGADTRVQSALVVAEVAEPYIRRRAVRHLEKNRMVILAAGTGNPHFTTDTAAALRATELGCEVLLKASKVDGVYTDDPHKNPKAKKIERLSYLDVLNQRLGVMDITAISMCMEHRLPIIVFNLRCDGNILKAVSGLSIGTIIEESDSPKKGKK